MVAELVVVWPYVTVIVFFRMFECAWFKCIMIFNLLTYVPSIFLPSTSDEAIGSA